MSTVSSALALLLKPNPKCAMGKIMIVMGLSMKHRRAHAPTLVALVLRPVKKVHGLVVRHRHLPLRHVMAKTMTVMGLSMKAVLVQQAKSVHVAAILANVKQAHKPAWVDNGPRLVLAKPHPLSKLVTEKIMTVMVKQTKT